MSSMTRFEKIFFKLNGFLIIYFQRAEVGSNWVDSWKIIKDNF